MGEPRQRQCLHRLIDFSARASEMERGTVAAQIDSALACSTRRACSSYLACSWLAAELATGLMQRFR